MLCYGEPHFPAEWSANLSTDKTLLWAAQVSKIESC